MGYNGMSYEFHAFPDPSKDLYSKVAALAPANPFYTSTYAEARRLWGCQTWVLALRRDEQMVSACTAFIKIGHLNRSLEISSLPMLPDAHAFWGGLLELCHKLRISCLEVNSFASRTATIPALRGEIARRIRTEHVLELQHPRLWDGMSSNHVRNIQRGRRAGLEVQRTADALACQDHARLVEASMNRRNNRGESVSVDIQAQSFAPIIQSHAGECFRAILRGEVLSSVLVLFAQAGAYYQSAGTSPQGMNCGASHFILYETGNALRRQSMEVFNLGGADPLNPGLERFKAGFGGSTVRLEAAHFFLGSKLRRTLGMMRQLLPHGLFD